MQLEIIFDGGNGASVEKEAYGSFQIITSGGDNKIERVSFGTGYTNNQAEYMTLIAALQYVKDACDKKGVPYFDVELRIKGDSELVRKQVGTYKLVQIPWSSADTPEYVNDWSGWKVNVAHLIPLRETARQLLQLFYKFDYQHIPRKEVVKVLGH